MCFFFNLQCLRYLATAISICFASLVLGLKLKGVRTSHSAPVLIVLPLGQICAWRGKQFYGRVFVYPHNMPELGDLPIWDVDSPNFSGVCKRILEALNKWLFLGDIFWVCYSQSACQDIPLLRERVVSQISITPTYHRFTKAGRPFFFR